MSTRTPINTSVSSPGYIMFLPRNLIAVGGDPLAGIAPSPTLDEFIDEHFWPDKIHLRFLTLRGYHRHVRAFISPVLGTLPIAAISYSDVQRMINACPTRKAAKDAKGTLSAILGHAVKLRFIAQNPAIGEFVYPDAIERKRPAEGVWLTDFAQIMKVMNAAREYEPGGEIERLCLLGYGFGLRKGEILGVNSEDFDLERGSLTVLRSYTRGQAGPEIHGLKTLSSRRELPILGYVRDRINDIGLAAGPFVAHDSERINPSTAAKHFKAFREAAGLPEITIATMRHSFATAMIRSGRSIATVQQWLGHTTPTTTLNAYVRPSMDDLIDDAREVDRIIANIEGDSETVSVDLSKAEINAIAEALGLLNGERRPIGKTRKPLPRCA